MKLRNLKPGDKYFIRTVQWEFYEKIDDHHSYSFFSNPGLDPGRQLIHSDPDLDVIPQNPEEIEKRTDFELKQLKRL